MTFSELRECLKLGGVSEWQSEAFILAEHFGKVSRAALLADPEAELSPDVDNALTRRLSGEVLQYILGEWSFYSRNFKVTEGCLVPRGDTEILCEEAISIIPEGSLVADICSGSGCIGITLLLERPDLSCVSYDLYDTPLRLTRENAELLGVSDRLSVIRADVLSDLDLPENVGFILSNPPYIPSGDISELSEDVRREPHTALDGGEDGLVFYRRLLDIVKDRRIPALFEIGYDQGESIALLAKERDLDCEIKKDLSGLDRIARIGLRN